MVVTDIRLAEITGSLALAIDLAFGQQVEQVLRTCLLAGRIGERAGLTDEQLRELYWVAQLRFVGCTAHAHEVSGVTGDEIAARAESLTLDNGSPQEVFRWLVRHAGSGVGTVAAMSRVAKALAGGQKAVQANFRAGAEES